MRLEVWPSIMTIIKTILSRNGQLLEACLLDVDEGLVNHLLHCVWQQVNNDNGLAFLEAAKEFFDQVAWILLWTPPTTLINLLLCRVGSTPICTSRQ